MTTPHRAKPHQWTALQEASALSASSCILELRDRVEALEKAALGQQHGKAADSATAPSLVDRVAIIIANWSSVARPGDDAKPTARAAIREVAAWLQSEHLQREGFGASWADLLDQEAAQ